MFEFTREGYEQALVFLKEIGKLAELEKEQSVDGYTLVALANFFKRAEELNDI
jgi:hypothetical protein